MSSYFAGAGTEWCQDRRSSGWSQKRPNWAASAGVELARLGRGRITLAAFEYFTFCPSDPILKHVRDNNPVVWYICRADSPKVPCDLCPDQSSSLNLPTTWPGDTFRLLFTIKEWNGGWKQIGFGYLGYPLFSFILCRFHPLLWLCKLVTWIWDVSSFSAAVGVFRTTI